MKVLSLIVTLFLFTTLHAQVNETRWCGQPAAQEKLFHRHPGIREGVDLAKAELEEYTREYEANRSGGDPIYTIPVVFHVIHNNGTENISDEQIHDAVSILTRDFRKQNADIADVVPAFQSITADCGIEFKLATKDPQGNCHSGINRIVSTLTYNGNYEAKELIYWPRNKYLNIWVCANANGAAGYSIMPPYVSDPGSAPYDGIVVTSTYVGSIGTGSLTRSRTLTHEVGHWLNLMHPWGDTNDPEDPNNCNNTDYVDDTPKTIGHTTCDLTSSTCDGTLDNVQNYMDYSYCDRMFTNGQRARMRAALTSNVAKRNQLITQSNLAATGVINPSLCVAAFKSSARTGCVGSNITFEDISYHAITSWSWNFGDGNTLSGTNPNVHKNPVHQYTTPGTYTVSLTVGNGTNTLTKTIENYLVIYPVGMIAQNIYEGFEGDWPNANFFIDNQNDDLTFEVTPSAAYSGSKSLKLRNYSNTPGNTDILYSAVYDLSNATDAALSYRWSYTNKTTPSNDQLNISFSGDCGTTWSVRRSREGSSGLPTAAAGNAQYTPTTSSQWQGESLSIGFPNWLTNSFQFKFEFTGKGGNNLYLDDINLTANFPVGVEEVKPVFVFGVYPNPSENNMKLDFTLQGTDDVSIVLYNSTGQLCESLYSGRLAAGNHTFDIERQPAGLYNIVVRAGERISVQKVIFE